MEYKLEELLPLITKLSEQYTGRESTSLTYEAAEKLMEAVVYCINESKEVLLEEKTDGDKIIPLKQNLTAEQAYHSGYEMIMTKARRSNELYTSISKDFCDYGNYTYFDTVLRGMPEFFKKYDPKFAPQDHLLTLDYPTLLPWEEHCGIDAIYLYLQYIELEQIFLSAFPYERIIQVLTKYHNNYKELIINISGLVLNNILCCIIARKSTIPNNITEQDMTQIKKLTDIYTKEELLYHLQEIVKHFVKEGYGGNPALYEYLLGGLNDFIYELRFYMK